MTTVPAIRGKIGNIEYYQCTMNAHDLITRTQNATEYFSKKTGRKWVIGEKIKEKLIKDI